MTKIYSSDIIKAWIVQVIKPIPEETKEYMTVDDQPTNAQTWVWIFGRDEPITSELSVEEWAKILGTAIPHRENLVRRIRG